MSAELLAGGPVAEAVLEDVRIRVEWLKEAGTTPGLGTILVGDDGLVPTATRMFFEAIVRKLPLAFTTSVWPFSNRASL